MKIRRLSPAEFDLVWPMFHAIVREGKTFTYDPATTYEQGKAIWFSPERTVYAAQVDGQVVGTFYLRSNQLGLGAHVGNGGFMIAPEHAGKGYGTQMGALAIEEAKKLGYHALQYNFVVEDNEPSLRVWKKLGFEVIGRVPEAFRHSEKGLTGVYILYKKL